MRNHVAFDNSKDEMFVFTQCRKADLPKRLVYDQITVREHTMRINVNTTK